MSKERWTEIKFIYFILDLYKHFRDYTLVYTYLDLLAYLSKSDQSKVRILMQTILQERTVRPGRVEFIQVARQNNISIRKIRDILGIGQGTYMKYAKAARFDVEVPPKFSSERIELMDLLIKTHKNMQTVGEFI